MRICRFITPDNVVPRFGFIEGLEVHPLDKGETFETINNERTEKPLPIDGIRLLAPVLPSKIVCVGRNYHDHAAELGNLMPLEPLLFLKPPSSVVGHRDFIKLPVTSTQVEHEGELGVVIGRRARSLPANEDPLAYVLGYTCVNDVTARDLQRKDVQFTRAKSFDSFCPVGPVIVSMADPQDLKVETRVQGVLRQSARTSVMAFSVSFLVHYISQIMTLEHGDLISTGTPAGVGPLLDGETVEVEIEGIGTLVNFVRKEENFLQDSSIDNYSSKHV